VESKAEVLRCYIGKGSPRVLLTAATVVSLVRLGLGDWGVADLVVVAVTVLLAGPVEWTIHLYLLHAPVDSFRMQRLGTGQGHRMHHLDPTDLQWILLSVGDAVSFLPMLVAFTAIWSLPLLWILGGPVLLPFLTAVAAAWIGICHYEWTHLLVHTRYSPKSRYYSRLARNHRLHHYRNEHYWLGVTSNSGDRLMRTLPKNKSDVPLSDTARSLE